MSRIKVSKIVILNTVPKVYKISGFVLFSLYILLYFSKISFWDLLIRLLDIFVDFQISCDKNVFSQETSNVWLLFRPLLHVKVYMSVAVAWAARIVGGVHMRTAYSEGKWLILRQGEEGVKKSNSHWDSLNVWKYGHQLSVWLYVPIMSRRRFRVNPHSIIAWMSRNPLLETGAKSEV